MKIIPHKTDWGVSKMFVNQDNTVRFAIYFYYDDLKTIYFSNLFIDEKHRNKGYANKILEYVFAYAKQHNYTSVILNVIKNSWMEDWYKRKGFHFVIDCVDDYKGNVWLKKEIL